VKHYGGKVRVVYKNLVVHPDTAMAGHLAACAAGMQGKFMEFKSAYWEKAFGPYYASQGRDTAAMMPDNMLVIGKGIGLDAAKLDRDMKGPECMGRMQKDMDELEKFRVGATPSFFINGTFVGGALDIESFKQIIDEKLKIAEASGVPAAEYYDKEIMAKGEKKFRSRKDPKPK
jgi:protein-disulfide isomerase